MDTQVRDRSSIPIEADDYTHYWCLTTPTVPIEADDYTHYWCLTTPTEKKLNLIQLHLIAPSICINRILYAVVDLNTGLATDNNCLMVVYRGQPE